MTAAFGCGVRGLGAATDASPGDVTTADAEADASAPEAGALDASVDAPAGSDASDAGIPRGADAGICGTGSVTFRLDPGPGGPWHASTSGDEEPDWLAIFTASGTPLYRQPAEFALTSCDCDAGWGIPIGWGDSNLGDAGVSDSWNGFYFNLGTFSDSGSCASTSFGPPRGSCLKPGCAPPGQYVAYMCACQGEAKGSSTFSKAGVPSSYAYYVADCANPTCVRVPFEYPSQGVVVGAVSAGDQ
ncbi:MAG TPA: hypothetical protein VKU41_05095 [Polyangiaceae bacterium]|nr:hypothetical protein [Polyangiaceae bacterium]